MRWRESVYWGRRWDGKSKVVCRDQRHTNNTRYAFFFISKLRFLQELNARQLFCRLATGIFQHILKEIITGLFCPSLHPITCRTSTSSSGLFAWKLECWWGVILYNRLANSPINRSGNFTKTRSVKRIKSAIFTTAE